MKYSWVLFDADDTLFDFSKSARHAFAETLEQHGIPFQPAHFQTYKSINDEAWRAFELGQITAMELRKVRFEKFLNAIGEYRDPLEMNAFYLQLLSKTKFLMEGAVQLVEALLAKNYHLGLITNGLKEVQRPRISNAGMAHYFEVIVVSDEIGVSKPHAGFFEHAFSMMKSPAKDQVLVVGDSLHSDIQGGNQFGLDTCWLNSNAAANLTEIQPIWQIRRLEELHDILA